MNNQKQDKRTTYNREYMNKYYKKNPLKCRLSRNTSRVKFLNKGSFTKEQEQKYGYHLSHFVKMSILYKELTPELRELLKSEIDDLDFPDVHLKV